MGRDPRNHPPCRDVGGRHNVIRVISRGELSRIYNSKILIAHQSADCVSGIFRKYFRNIPLKYDNIAKIP